MSDLETEAARRRTFAIISHPDAGKTTLTEKILLYGGAIHLAGSVKARKTSRHAVSDWMEMEKTRGISITSSVLQFDHLGRALNLLDTPGHADFSEDTYRTLSAVDSAVMLVDHAKGVESRTLRLFEVCRLRRLPVLTFMNKMDRDGRDPLELLDDVTSSLGGLQCTPINWPIGMGRDFRGVVDVRTNQVTLFESEGKHGMSVAASRGGDWDDFKAELDPALVEDVEEQLELARLVPLRVRHLGLAVGVHADLGRATSLARVDGAVEERVGVVEPPRHDVGVGERDDDARLDPDDAEGLAKRRNGPGGVTQVDEDVAGTLVQVGPFRVVLDHLGVLEHQLGELALIVELLVDLAQLGADLRAVFLQRTDVLEPLARPSGLAELLVGVRKTQRRIDLRGAVLEVDQPLAGVGHGSVAPVGRVDVA